MPESPGTAVVLGGAGFLGKRLVAMLADEGGVNEVRPQFASVRVLDKESCKPNESVNDAATKSGIELTSVVGNIQSCDDLRSVLKCHFTGFTIICCVRTCTSQMSGHRNCWATSQ